MKDRESSTREATTFEITILYDLPEFFWLFESRKANQYFWQAFRGCL